MYGEVVTPSGMRGHTAVVCNNAMHVYGGYQDMKGSINQLWTFDFGELCIIDSQAMKQAGQGPLQLSASTQSQCCDDTKYKALTENNKVTQEWVVTSFWCDSVCYRPHSKGMAKVLFSQASVCSQEGEGGLPHLHPTILPSTGPMSFLGVVP